MVQMRGNVVERTTVHTPQRPYRIFVAKNTFTVGAVW